MDADPENYDGFNYMYLAEDADNLYVALDLVSDQTNEPDGEWVGIWLNTNNTIINDSDYDIASEKWADSLNKGMESLLVDVENNMTMPFIDPLATKSWYRGINSLSHLIPREGTFEGSLTDLQTNYDANYANMTSAFNGTHYTYRLDVELPFYEYFTIFPNQFVDNIDSLQLYAQVFHNVIISNHYVTIRDSLGNLLLENTDYTKSINTNTGSQFTVSGAALPGNFTQDDKVLFSYIGVHDSPFKTSFDSIWTYYTIPITDLAAGYLDYPYSSIENYEIAWSFGGSENNVTAHRIFEMKIPKSELDGYNQDADLGIMVGGYGTLAGFPNSHHWVFANNTDTGMPFENSDNYHYYSMPMKGWVQPNKPALSALDPNPSTTGQITLTWNPDPNVVNWTVLRYGSSITEFNIDDVEVLDTGLTTNQFNDYLNTTGTYYYAVVAIDTLGYAYLSNVESVTVTIATSTSSSSTTTITTTSTTTVTTGSSATSLSSSSSTDTLTDNAFLPGFSFFISSFTIFISLFYYKKMK